MKCSPNLYINVKEALYGRNQWDDCQYFVGDCTEVFNVDDQCCGRNDCSLVVRKIYSIKCLAYVSFFRIIYECETGIMIYIQQISFKLVKCNEGIDTTDLKSLDYNILFKKYAYIFSSTHINNFNV